MTRSAHTVPHSFAVALSALVALGAHALPAQNGGPLHVAPADRALFEGSASSSYPLGRWNHRLQQLHGDFGPNPVTLNGHAYRRDAIQTRDGLAGFTVDLEVIASSAPHGPAGAQRDFAANTGSDATVVLPRTTLTFPATGRPGDAPAPDFEFVIPWTAPFTVAPGATLCLDVTIFGNALPTGSDRNFSLPLDAHAYPTDGSVEQPGYRRGSGCAASNGSGREHSARLGFVRDGQGNLALEIESRNGVPGGSGSPSLLGLLVGTDANPTPWPARPTCVVYPRVIDAYRLSAGLNAQGDWAGTLQPVPLPVGARFHAQLVSGIPFVDMTLSEGVVLDVPPPAPANLPGVRIASGSDRSATQGTVSRTLTVTRFF